MSRPPKVVHLIAKFSLLDESHVIIDGPSVRGVLTRAGIPAITRTEYGRGCIILRTDHRDASRALSAAGFTVLAPASLVVVGGGPR